MVLNTSGHGDSRKLLRTYRGLMAVMIKKLDRQGSNFDFCIWRAVPFHLSHHPQDVSLAQFSLHVHKGDLKPHSFYFYTFLNFSCIALSEIIWKEILFPHNKLYI